MVHGIFPTAIRPSFPKVKVSSGGEKNLHHQRRVWSEHLIGSKGYSLALWEAIRASFSLHRPEIFLALVCSLLYWRCFLKLLSETNPKIMVCVVTAFMSSVPNTPLTAACKLLGTKYRNKLYAISESLGDTSQITQLTPTSRTIINALIFTPVHPY